MSANELTQWIDKLHQALSNGPSIDEEAAEKMRELLKDIESALDQRKDPPSDSEASPSLTARVQSLLTDFEIQHPTLSSHLNAIAERLSDMGI